MLGFKAKEYKTFYTPSASISACGSPLGDLSLTHNMKAFEYFDKV